MVWFKISRHLFVCWDFTVLLQFGRRIDLWGFGAWLRILKNDRWINLKKNMKIWNFPPPWIIIKKYKFYNGSELGLRINKMSFGPKNDQKINQKPENSCKFQNFPPFFEKLPLCMIWESASISVWVWNLTGIQNMAIESKMINFLIKSKRKPQKFLKSSNFLTFFYQKFSNI